ncbi:MAG TPA: hypothetical protein ENG06_00615 [Thermoplasmatales archaeon]|nr:MAG: hypothetical protein DRN07_05320 [Thermoplasmata archaeon]HDN50258.1 hypothetical protein [Thermoplasmatales archaeon]
MKKFMVIALTVLLLLPLNHSEKAGDSSPVLPSKEDVIGFLFSLQKRIDGMHFFQDANVVQELVIATGNVAYAGGGADPLRDSMEMLYEARHMAYNESALDDFVASLNFTDEESMAIALLMFSYASALTGKSRAQQLEGVYSLFSFVRKTAPVLMNASVNETATDPYGIIIFGGPGNGVYNGNHTFIIDFGGDDVYMERSNSFVLDISGNDTYRNQTGISGITPVFDLSGSDTYHDFPSSAAGTTTLLDLTGNDSYLGRVGTSYELGITAMIDMEGNDLYAGGDYTQCYAQGGTSILLDVQGDDIYNASTHSQGCSVGGFALLIDCYGDDSFIAGDCSQAYAKGFPKRGMAVLVNGAGDDFYQAGDFSQGYGEQSGIAVLFDFMGEDSYTARHFSQASSSLLGMAALIDSDGGNTFDASSFSQGYQKLGLQALFLNQFDFQETYEILDFLDTLNVDVREIVLYLLQS